eukprot:NODE_3990_length_881_cov_28.275240_g3678_i0.p1 GENE.NODE_3990_length_881_cov_28.275240_g3678_i0~~NODE_3990_length_881_cov_28.275240_g3678_i0.p1  ORF type:complete len:222 (+),score=36.45 NODE_3990_length_881_cov_28.275240_g3678_i0:91-756(+)
MASSNPSAKRFGAHNDRNQQPILAVLQRYLPPPSADVSSSVQSSKTSVLEIACGSGQHAHFMPTHMPHLRWLPTDTDETTLPSVVEWTRGMPNVEPPQVLDVTSSPDLWPAQESFDAVYACNITHISPWEATLGLLAVAAHSLRAGGKLFVYGPFNVGGKFTSQGNENFHYSLQQRDSRWGIRDVEAVDAAAQAVGFHHLATEQMPANNLMVIWSLGDRKA